MPAWVREPGAHLFRVAGVDLRELLVQRGGGLREIAFEGSCGWFLHELAELRVGVRGEEEENEVHWHGAF